MSTKNASAQKKVVNAAQPKIAQPAVAVAEPAATPAAAPVLTAPAAAPAAVETKAAAAPKKRATKAKEEPVAAAAAATPVAESAPVAASSAEPAVEDAEERLRPKLRAFNDIFTELSTSVNESYNLLQNAKRGLKSLQSAHNREIHNNSKTRESASRTPTIVFDAPLVAYFRKRLPATLLSVNRKGEHVDLSKLDTETRVHRTDVTQLYTAVFKHHKMQDPEDRRKVQYSQDPDLVSLLTTGEFSAGLAEDVKKIKEGTYKLTIFNIQRFTNHHLGKVDVPEEEVAAGAVATQ
jgi:hypothetical protein